MQLGTGAAHHTFHITALHCWDHRYLLLTPSVAVVSVSPVAPCRACQREVFVVFGAVPRCAHVISFATLLSSMRSVWKLTFENIFNYFTETNETGGLHLRQTGNISERRVIIMRDG